MAKKYLGVPNNIAVIVYVILLIVTLIMVGMLHVQYRFFIQELQKLMLVKESYNQHVEMLKRSLYASLSGESSESNDEPAEDLDLFVSSIDKEKRIEPFFELISPEEENKLFLLKKVHPRIKPVQTVPARKLLKRRKISAADYNQGNRCLSEIDFNFAWPIELSKFWLSSLYGLRKFSNGKISFHHGIDMASVRGTAVKASAGGKVVCAQYVSGYGNMVDIYHNKHYKTRYAHLYSIGVSVGQDVQVGQQIGTVGDTGHVRKSGKDGSHLHFEIHQDGQSINPLKFLFM